MLKNGISFITGEEFPQEPKIVIIGDQFFAKDYIRLIHFSYFPLKGNLSDSRSNVVLCI